MPMHPGRLVHAHASQHIYRVTHTHCLCIAMIFPLHSAPDFCNRMADFAMACRNRFSGKPVECVHSVLTVRLSTCPDHLSRRKENQSYNVVSKLRLCIHRLHGFCIADMWAASFTTV